MSNVIDEINNELGGLVGKYKIETKNCVSRGECHPETCNHWNYYLTRNGERLMGSDDIEEVEEMLRVLNEERGIPTL